MAKEDNSKTRRFQWVQGSHAPDVQQQGPDIHDIALFSVNGVKCLAVVASPQEHVGEEPRRREIRIWSFDESEHLVRPLLTRGLDLPFPKEVALHSVQKQIIAAGASNFEWPGFIGRYRAEPGTSGLDGTLDALPLALSREQLLSVKVPLKWSTVGLSCQEWLYAPRIHPAESTSSVIVSMATTDGQSVLWRYTPQSGTLESLALFAEVVNPVVFETSDVIQLLHRVPDQHWSGFHDSPLYAFARGPVALPLALLEFNLNGTEQGKKRLHMDPSFAFDAVVDPVGGFLIATVGGSQEEPRLVVYRTPALDQRWEIYDFLSLQQLPIEVRVLAAEGAILIALLYQIGAERSVECFYRAPNL